ncbi:MAG: CcmD family protein [Calditrichaeota bacterium]|nr:CcmD family protein [Calditrichota bacterium]
MWHIIGMYMLNVLGMLMQPETKPVGQNIYVVLAVTLIVWLGVFFFLIYLDRQLKQVKQKVEWQEGEEKK